MVARALLLLCMVALGTSVYELVRHPPEPDTAYLQRFAPARLAVPRIAYFGGPPRVRGLTDDLATGLLFAQAALLPSVLLPGDTTLPFALYNFASDAEAGPHLPARARDVRHLGPGLYLVHRVP